MIPATALPAYDRSARWWVSVRWCGLAVALAVELLALSLRFESLRDHQRSLVDAARRERFGILRISVAFCGVFLLLLAPRLKAWFEAARECAAGHRWPVWFTLHVLAYVAFYFATAATFGGKYTFWTHVAGDRLALTAGTGVVTLGLWFLALAPLRFWRDFVVQERLTLAAAALAAFLSSLAGEITQRYWRTLASQTFFLVERLLRLAYPDVVSDPSTLVLGTRHFAVQINSQCSGYEGIGLVTVFLTIYLWLFRDRIRFPQAFLLFPIGMVAIWLANIVRITLLIAIGISWSPIVALGGFHSQAGWLSFVALAVGFIVITHRIRFFTLEDAPGSEEEVNPLAAALLIPFMVLMGSMMLTSAFTHGFDSLYPLRILVTAAALLWFRRVYARWEWSWSWLAVGIGAGVFVVWMVLERFMPGEDAMLGAGVAALSETQRAVWLGSRVLGSVLVIPLVEELAFRGYLMRRLAGADMQGVEPGRFSWVSFLVSSVAFGLMHGRWLAGTLAGMAFALALYRRGRLSDAVLAHMTANALIALAVLIAGAWSLWS